MRIVLSTFIAAAIVSLTALASCIAANAAEPNTRARPDANSIGIWKAVVPHSIKAELDNYDPIGLVAGALIKTDCAYNWRDPDDGKLYCFASPSLSSISGRGRRPTSSARTTPWRGWVAPKPGS
jgi:hypothetical protein